MSKRIKALLILFGVIFLCYNVPLFFKMGRSVFKSKYIEEPKYYKEILKNLDSSLLSHKYTISEDSLFPVSVYQYDTKYAIVFFRRNLFSRDVLDSIKFHNQTIKKESYKIYTSFLSLDELKYSFEYIEPIKKLDLSIENFKESYLKFKSENTLYLSFPLNSKMGLSFNGLNSSDLVVSRNDPRIPEYNEILILVKEDFLYFIYLKPFNKNESDKSILTKLILD